MFAVQSAWRRSGRTACYWSILEGTALQRHSNNRRYSSTSHDEQTHHHAAFRARKAFAEQCLRTYGFRLALVNPLRRDGLMERKAEDALSAVLRPLVQHLVQVRKNKR